MLEALIESLNRIAAMMTASLVNTLPVTIAAGAIAFLAARSKGWSAATRYGLWWLIFGFVIAAPFVSAFFAGEQDAPVRHVSIMPGPVAVSTAHSAPQPLPVVPSPVRPSLATIFLLCWIIASGAQAARVLRGFVYGWRLKRASAAPDRNLECLFQTLRPRLSIRRRVSLSISSDISSPAVVGYRNPHVMIPADLASRLSLDEMEQILLHELAHVARYDDWTIAAQRLIEAAGICHPLIRYVAHRLNLDREMACDDCVAAICERGRYAECLAKVAQMNPFSAASAVLVPLLERKSELLARVEVLLDNTRTHLPRVSRPRLLIASAAFILLGIVGLRAPKLVAMPAYGPRHLSLQVDLAPTPRVFQTAQQEAKPNVAENIVAGVDFKDQQGVPQETLRAIVKEKKGVVFNEDLLHRDFVALWNTGRFDDVRVERSKGPNGGVMLAFVVAERDAEQTTAASERPQSGIYSIVVTSEDGSSSMFGSWSRYSYGDSGREPGTIEFKSDNKIYVIRDKGVLAEAQKMIQPMEELGRRQSELGEKQSKLGDAQSALGDQQSKVAERELDASSQAKLAQKLQILKARIDELNAKKLAQRPSDIQEQLGNLQSALAEMQSDMGSVQGRLGGEQEVLGKKQAELGQQQEELGKQQAGLGARQEAESRRVEKALRDLIQNAQTHGLVQQVR